MADTKSNGEWSAWPWWPMFVMGLTGPLLAPVLDRWIAHHLSVAVAFAAAWLGAGLIFVRFPPAPEWRFGRWMIGGVLGAIVAGGLAWLGDGTPR